MLLVTILGPRSLRIDGVGLPGPRGHKAWGLLAYLVGNGAPVPRDRLVSLLFPDAANGRAALRWNLGQLRQAVHRPESFTGDPVVLGLGPDVRVDVQVLAAAPWYEVVDRVDVGGTLLEGLDFPTCPGFGLWLEGERRRMVELGSVALREAARAKTAEGRPADAVAHARRLVELQPWEETGHELLVRALAQAGQVDAARAHVALVTDLFLAELGQPPARSLAAAAEPVLSRPARASRAGTSAQLQAGVTAMSAGAAAAGIDSLRRAVAGARVVRDADLLVQTLTTFGSAQVHAVRGADESGVAALREAVSVAERAGRPELATWACRELGYVEFLRCRFEPAERWLDRAVATVGADHSERAWILAIRGSLRSDAGRHAEALAVLEDAVRHAETAGDLRAAAFALTHLGRLHLLREEDEAALDCLHHAQRLTERAGWLSFAPYPMAWAAEALLRTGNRRQADELLATAHALALEVGDPCWESLTCRGLGLLAAAAGDHETAARLLHDAPAACRRVPDAYVWVEAYGLAAQAAHALSRGLPHGSDLVDELDRLASAHGIGELRAEASLLRLAAGQPGALDAARSHVAAVDNPVLAARLHRLLQPAAPPPPAGFRYRKPRAFGTESPGRARAGRTGAG